MASELVWLQLPDAKFYPLVVQEDAREFALKYSTMGKFPILKKRRDFLRAAKNTNVISKNVMLQAAPSLSVSEQQPARIGFTATKKLGKAWLRNRTKRRLRAVIREIYKKYALQNVDYVLIGRRNTYICPFEELRADTIHAFKKINKQLKSEEAENAENIAVID